MILAPIVIMAGIAELVAAAAAATVTTGLVIKGLKDSRSAEDEED